MTGIIDQVYSLPGNKLASCSSRGRGTSEAHLIIAYCSQAFAYCDGASHPLVDQFFETVAIPRRVLMHTALNGLGPHAGFFFPCG